MLFRSGYVTGFKPYVVGDVPRVRTVFDRSKDHDAQPCTQRDLNLIGYEHARIRYEQMLAFLTSAHNPNIQLPVVKFSNGQSITVFPDCCLTELDQAKPPSLLARTQIPLLAGWAMTIHKAQGMTMEKVIVDLTSAFLPMQAYVALSRAKNLAGLQVIGDKFLGGGLVDNVVTEFLRETEWL